MEQVRLELCLEQEEEAKRQREIVSNLNATILATFLVPLVFQLATVVVHKNLHPTGRDGEEDQA